jgi:hypothetical protein
MKEPQIMNMEWRQDGYPERRTPLSLRRADQWLALVDRREVFCRPVSVAFYWTGFARWESSYVPYVIGYRFNRKSTKRIEAEANRATRDVMLARLLLAVLLRIRRHVLQAERPTVFDDEHRAAMLAWLPSKGRGGSLMARVSRPKLRSGHAVV